MIPLVVASALAHSERAMERGPVAWVLAVEGKITRNDGTWLDVGESIEVGAALDVPIGGVAVVAHAGRIERWEGPSRVHVGPVAARLDIGNTQVRRPHVEELGNALTGDVRAPAGPGQLSSALGIPLTAASWARQDVIDGGTLHALYRDVLEDRLAAANVDRAVVAKLGLLDALPGSGEEQVALVGRYLDLAGATPDAALLLEAPPTDMGKEAVQRHLLGTFGDVVRGEGPHTFRVGDDIDKVRLYAEDVADALRRRGKSVFAVRVPYANTAENILLRSARPADGVEVLHQLLVRAGGVQAPMETIAMGYSQGAAVVRDYVERYGDSDGLDYAIDLATMGGADAAGADGVWSGKRGRVRGEGVTVLAVSHVQDPARWVYGRGFFQLFPGLSNYAGGGRARGGDVAFHVGHFGSSEAPLAHGDDAVAALAVGTFGYPTAYLAGLYDDLLAGAHDVAWGRRGDWTWDARVELPGRDHGDYGTWRTDPRVVADGYRPAAAGTSIERSGAPDSTAGAPGAALTPAPSR